MSFYDHPRAGRPDWRKYIFALTLASAAVVATLIERWLT
jgi:hypothetical protein